MPRFQETFCSQCGAGFGPGDAGYSHCVDHQMRRMTSAEKLHRLAEMFEEDPEGIDRVLWRLDVLRDDLIRERDKNDFSIVDHLCNGAEHVTTG